MMRWNYKELDYDSINKEELKDKDFLFYLIACASFVEITSDVYEKNLEEFYSDEEDVKKWLKEVWEPEEIQHGVALREFVKRVWSDFDWDKAYDKFKKEYLPLCTIDEFQDSKAKEMLARMVVETGTSTLYKSISKLAKDENIPLLEELASNISKDEVYHYDQFYELFKKFNEKEKLGRDDIVKVIYDRLKMIDGEDAKIAFKAVFEEKNQREFKEEDYEEYKKSLKVFIKKYYPYNMAIKMLLQPLNINKTLESAMVPIIKGALKVLGI